VLRGRGRELSGKAMGFAAAQGVTEIRMNVAVD
jgi:hypothetical protein